MERSRSNQDAWRHIVSKVALLAMPLVMGLLAGSCGNAGPADDARETTSSAHLPAGYALRLDRPNRDPADFVVTVHSDSEDLTVHTGPAGILYRPSDMTESDGFTFSGRFTEIDAPIGHREGFGLFIGGEDLGGAAQRYTYFLVRGDGRYLIKQRHGDETTELSEGWQPSDAVRVPTSPGEEVSNELAISIVGRQLRLACNDEPVAELPVGDLSTQGVVGIRVNHNLHVRIESFGVEG